MRTRPSHRPTAGTRPMSGNEAWVALVAAAGQSRRFGGDTPKQSLRIADRSLLGWSLLALENAGCDRALVAVCDPASPQMQAEIAALGLAVEFCPGGPSRAASVLNMLRHLAEYDAADRWVLVHDAARPCVRSEQIRILTDRVRQRATAQASRPVGGALAMPLDAALRRPVELEINAPEQCLDRDGLWIMQTPQMFRACELLNAMENWRGELSELEDESRAFVANGGEVLLVAGSAANLKVTRGEDLAVAEKLLSSGGGR